MTFSPRGAFKLSVTKNPKNKTQITLIATLIGLIAIVYIGKSNIPLIKGMIEDGKYLKAYDDNMQNLKNQRDAKQAKLDSLLKEYDTKDPNDTDAFTSKIRVEKANIITEINLLTVKHNMDYMQVTFVSSDLLQSTANPDGATPNTEESTDSPNSQENSNIPNMITPGSESTNTQTNQSKPNDGITPQNDNPQNQEDSSRVLSKNATGRLYIQGTINNPRFMSSSYAIKGEIANYNQPQKSDTTIITNGSEDDSKNSSNSTSENTLPTNTDSPSDNTISNPSLTITVDGIEKFSEKILNNYATMSTPTSEDNQYKNERVMLAGIGSSKNAFNMIQSLYLSKTIKFNIEYIVINRDADFNDDKAKMYNYDKDAVGDSVYFGVVLNVLSPQDAPNASYESIENPVDIGDLFN